MKQCVGVLVLVSLLACGDREDQSASDSPSSEGGAAAAADHPETAIPVRAVPVVREDLLTYMETYARLEPERQVSVYSRTAGLVDRLRLEEGDTVSLGQVLVELEREEASLLLRASRAEHAEAKASLERSRQLYKQNMTIREEFEARQLRHENTAVEVEKAEIGLAHTTIRAPVSGVVMERLVEQGDLLSERQEICVIADVDPLVARVHVPERQMNQIRPGQAARISAGALPGLTFDSRVQRVSPRISAESGTVEVTLEVPADHRLKPGMFATVRLITGRRPRTLVIPKAALVLETEEDDVIAIVDSRAQRVPVEFGLVEGDRVEVVAGVSEGDMLVTVGHNGLKEGTLLRVVSPASSEGADGEQP